MSVLASLLPALANHLWQTTLVVAVIGVCAFAMRANRARVRYAMWFAASAKFAVPFSALTALGTSVDWADPSPGFQPGLDFFELTATMVEPVTGADLSRGALAGVAALVWLAGALLVAAVWCRSWRRTRAAVRSSNPWTGPRIDGWRQVRMSSPGAAPGVFGILRPVLLLPAGLELRLTPEELASVIAHETAHARHRDNLTASLHALISAVFWFHPFVWWIGRRMSDERERAADEAAVAAGFSPRVYAGGLLKVCRSAVRPALACAARVDGSNLTRRIEGIMKHSQIRNVHPVLRLTVASLAVLFAAGPVLIGMSRSVVTEASWASRSLPASPEPAESPQVGEPIAGSEAADQWVRQEVAYIIGKEERGAFEALATTEERRHFIEQFWQRRDPTPGTENEFHEEHDRRFAEANRRFAYGDLAGWETDRGRIYVAYGEPARVETGVSGAGQPTSIAVERWQYDFIEGLGLDVVLTFVDVNRTGEYLLMNPEPTAAEAASEPLRIGAGVLPPRVIARIEPEYPPDARAARVEGPVVLDAVVGRDGAVDVRRVVRSLRPDMDDAAVEAIRQWRFSPGTRDGEPVDVALNIEVHFSLR